MKAKILLCAGLYLFLSFTAISQVTENFTDGNFSADPHWTGDTASFIVNQNQQLQSNNTNAGSSFYLSTPNQLATTAQWEMYLKLNFNTSSANYVDVFLTASSGNLLLTGTTGYFVRLGGTTDEISLYRKDGSSITKIIDGTDGALNNSSNTVKIKVVRNAYNQFSLYSDLSGTGNNYSIEGSVTDATYLTAAFFGTLIKQSTAGFFQQHFFDNIEVKPFVPDTIPPEIISATAISQNKVDVLFNEPLDNSSSQDGINYFADNSVGYAALLRLDAINQSLVHLTFANNFPNGVNCTLHVNGVDDLSGNTINNGTAVFSYYNAQTYDVVIDEIMADANPAVALPTAEWIELKNTTAFPINLANWKLSDLTGFSGPMPSLILKPDSFLIVCGSGSVAALSAYGRTIAVNNFPSLNDDKDVLTIYNDSGKIIHSVGYSSKWYQNELKQNGGWSLEMIDTKNPCTGSNNWMASSDLRGGSPGIKNAVDAINTDMIGPRLLNAFAADSLHISLVFDEPLDQVNAALVNNYSISDGMTNPQSISLTPPVYNHVVIQLSEPLLHGKIYTVTVANLTDCMGNSIRGTKTVDAGLSEIADSLDVIINEILFNPPPNGNDYVELYNRSNKTINLKEIYIANRNLQGEISNITQVSTEDLLLFPKKFIVITENAEWVRKTYITLNPDDFAEPPSLPSFNNDKGDVIVLNEQGKITDELLYDEKWHFKLINNTEGVALERIDHNAPTQSADNWHSASTSAGYGTPTYKNSQDRAMDDVAGELTLLPEIVSPDNDGLDDFATLSYHFPQPGYVANITIFDVGGRPVRYLRQNALCGTAGSFIWDGLGEKYSQLPSGIYIVFTEVFNLKGKKKQFKNVIVLARKS